MVKRGENMGRKNYDLTNKQGKILHEVMEKTWKTLHRERVMPPSFPAEVIDALDDNIRILYFDLIKLYDISDVLKQERLTPDDIGNTIASLIDGTVPLDQLPEAFGGDLTELLQRIEVLENDIDRFYPIGTIYESVVNRNPAEEIGGTWTVWGQGRVSVGVDPADEDFDEAEKTGGAKTQALTVEEMPGHNHTQAGHTHSAHTGEVEFLIGNISRRSGVFQTAGSYRDVMSTSGSRADRFSINATHNSVTPTINNTGSGNAHNNLEPYITSYKWKRTG
jgi:microcystin-dependent protein